jgi:hypothetical protein
MLKNKLIDPACSKVFNTGLPAAAETSLLRNAVQLSKLTSQTSAQVKDGLVSRRVSFVLRSELPGIALVEQKKAASKRSSVAY